jgi:transglutaminase-like putative cysteine protease
VSRRALGYLILVAWAMSLGWLGVRRLLTVEDRQIARGAGRIGPSTSFYAVLLGERQVGTASIRLDTLPTGFRFTSQIVLNLPSGDGTASRLSARTDVTASRSFRLRQAAVTWSDPAGGGVMDLARVGDTSVTLRLQRGARDWDVLAELRGREHLVVGGTLPFHLAALNRLRSGAVVTADAIWPLRVEGTTSILRVGTDSLVAVSDSAAFDAASGRWGTVEGPLVTAWPVERTDAGLPVREWVDVQGRVLRREHPFGVTFERSPFEVNFTNYQAATRAGEATPVRAAGARLLRLPLERPPRGPDTVVVVVARLDGPASPVGAQGFAGGRQAVSADTVRIHRRGLPAPDGTPVPAADPGWIPAADRPVLQGALQLILGANPLSDTVAALAAWVARDVLLVEGSAPPAALHRMVRTGRAGPEGKARLLAALCQLAGIPARVVHGLDLSRTDLPGHTWVEVWRDGWQAVDPAADQMPASPWLLRVGAGVGRPVELTVQVGALAPRLLTPRSTP